MVMNYKEFEEYCRHRQYNDAAIELLGRNRSSEPSRRVKSGYSSVSGAFPSLKMKGTIQFESHGVELPFIVEMENDPDVIEYYDQPQPIKLNYKSQSGRSLGVMHTPDFLVITKSGAGYIECKTEDDLMALSVKQPHRYRYDEERQEWICPPGEEYAEQFGLSYRIRSSKETNWTLQRNVDFLDDYLRGEDCKISEEAVVVVTALIKKEPAVTLEKLFQTMDAAIPKDTVFFMIARQLIYFDFYAYLLTEPENARLFVDKETSEAYGYASSLNIPDEEKALNPETINIRPNTELIWDGKSWRILNVGEKAVSLVSQDEQIISVPIEGLKRLILNGSIRQSTGFDFEDAASKICEALACAEASELEIANRRVDIVRAAISGEKNTENIPERTLRKWKENYRTAETIHGNGYPGLIPRKTKGNTNSKLTEESIKLMDEYISNKYEAFEQRRKNAVYRLYKSACEKKGITSASYVTFCKQINKRSKYEETLKRQGRRAAYKYEHFYYFLDQTTPRHGERPFHIVHIDHTELDIELIDSVTGENLGRPWLTLMVDAYSRKILAVYLSFNKPSKISCMMVLRECVRRHGRLPQIIVVDGGKEFASVYFDTLLACYEVTKKTRPPAKSRYGSVVERMFGTANTQFVHNLRGNTQITKNVRQVTKSNNPKNLAIWNLPALSARLCEWAYEVYDQTEHSTLGQTPGDAFAQGMSRSGERLHRLIPYDEQFKLLTLPSTAKGTAKIDYTRGVKINRIFYWSEEFRNPEIAGTSVPVRFDPFDMGTAYVFVKGQWRECRSEHFRVFKNRSEMEIRLASAEMKKRGKQITVSALVKFLESVESEEILGAQRLKDRDHHPVARLINTGEILVEASKSEYASLPENPGTKTPDNVVLFPSAVKNEQSEELLAIDEDENFETYGTL